MTEITNSGPKPEHPPIGPSGISSEIRTTSSTGGHKGVKPERYSFIPKAPLDLLARIYGYGDQKYGDAHNYRKGYEWSKNYDALQRHLTAWWDREDTDPESGLSHLGHAAWHIFSLIVFASDPKYKQYDDRYGSADERFINKHAICYYVDGSHPESHVCLEHGQTSKYGASEGPNRACQAIDPWVRLESVMDTSNVRITHADLGIDPLVSKEGVTLLPEDERPFVHPDGSEVACEYRFVSVNGSVATGYYLCKVHESRTNRHPAQGANRPCIYVDPTNGDWGNVIPPAAGK